MIELLKEVDSTNLYIKKYLEKGENVIVCAEKQSGGRGTKGRSFLSNEGGVYLSALTFYHDLPAKDSFQIMLGAAVAVCKTAEFFGLTPQIKWPNDILVNGKKLCGILIENVLSGSKVRASIVGIGLNACNDLSSLEGIATSLSEQAGRQISTQEAREKLIEELKKPTSLSEYGAYLAFLGKEVRIVEGKKEYCATALCVEADGRLAVRVGGEEKLLSAAEISLRI